MHSIFFCYSCKMSCLSLWCHSMIFASTVIMLFKNESFLCHTAFQQIEVTEAANIELKAPQCNTAIRHSCLELPRILQNTKIEQRNSSLWEQKWSSSDLISGSVALNRTWNFIDLNGAPDSDLSHLPLSKFEYRSGHALAAFMPQPSL